MAGISGFGGASEYLWGPRKNKVGAKNNCGVANNDTSVSNNNPEDTTNIENKTKNWAKRVRESNESPNHGFYHMKYLGALNGLERLEEELATVEEQIKHLEVLLKKVNNPEDRQELTERLEAAQSKRDELLRNIEGNKRRIAELESEYGFTSNRSPSWNA